MKELIRRLLREHGGYFGNVITRKLPKELDNALYTLIHFLGKLDFGDVVEFADSATSEEIEELEELIKKFPSRQHEIIVSAGGFDELRNSELYTQIIDFVKTIGHEELIKEAGTHQELRLGDIPNSEKWITPETKKVLFRQWDKVGHADWKILKFVGIGIGNSDASFNNILDVIYPILRIEWEGGVKGTKAYEDAQEWRHEFFDDGLDAHGEIEYRDFEYRIIPVGYDFLMDESDSYGDTGYSCWNILVEFRPSSRRSPMIYYGLEIGVEIFDKKNYPLQSFRNYGQEELDLLEDIWEGNEGRFGDYFSQFCEVEVKVNMDYVPGLKYIPPN